MEALVLHEAAVELRGLPDVLRLEQRDPSSMADMQAFHLLRLRHPALEAGEVKFRAQGQHADRRADQRQALPFPGKHAHGPADQHFSGIPAKARSQ